MRPAIGIEAVVFDLDGTLVDSVADVRAALNRALAGEGRPAVSLAETRDFVGEGATVLVERALAAGGATPSVVAVERTVAAYFGFYMADPVGRTTVYPGVVEGLASLAARGVRLGVCTNKAAAVAALVLSELGLAAYFAAVAGGDSVRHRKPDGRHVRRTLEMMGARDRRAVMVGDSESDIAAGRAAGLPVVAVAYGYARRPAAELGADAVIGRFAELPAAFAAIAGHHSPAPTKTRPRRR